MFYLSIFIFYGLYTWLGIKYKFPRIVGAFIAFAVLILALWYVKVIRLDPAIHEFETYISSFVTDAEDEAMDDLGSPVFMLPFVLPFLLIDALSYFLIIIDIVIILGFCTAFFILGTSSALGLLFRSYKIAVLSFLSQGAAVAGFILTLRVTFGIFPDLSLTSYAVISTLGAIAAFPVPVIGYFIVWPWIHKKFFADVGSQP